ncbi:hypothetical protein THAOC_03147 [Thalassiosira oceanica]|uniref:Uncharacterized protein n=1 Tax=Thalassiosira oceanica TaxID=159749 RepID=K0TLA3_THAOC|nr:hypothetical protein THAOC_03147 [Thalassiosira oceanica]|eukprot:EJK75141.1 hypothetical protein THAOC_03147 [Thalassiosira oceanica]
MVNRHYEDSGSTIVPYDSRDTDCRKVRLLKDQKSYEAVASRRARLPDKVLERMWELSPDDDPHGFRRIAWLFTNIGRYAGLRIQEYGMDSCVVIKYCVLPDGTKVMRAFAVKDLLFYDEDEGESITISDAELWLISSPFVRVTAVNLLHKAEKDGAYIKLRLRDCYLIYLRNTDVIMDQHNAALEPAHRRMVALACHQGS